MLNILYAGCPDQSLIISMHFTFEIFGGRGEGLRSFMVIDMTTT